MTNTNLPNLPRLSEIHCDTDRCTQRITVTANLDETQAAAIARAAGWHAQLGAHRFMHWCAKHRPVGK